MAGMQAMGGNKMGNGSLRTVVMNAKDVRMRKGGHPPSFPLEARFISSATRIRFQRIF